MAEYTVEYLDGTVEVFPETSRPGGSYCTSGRADMGWFIIKDAYGKETFIPADRIKAINKNPGRW